ncbi:MAG: bifunctional [glutamate--ammonia ligase]-adenylyl-L-tyrosine phosphorylase/[glutamate--ammonia-ligase] adenylyltransferase [Planctomycetia bacterium]|nr:bifunctional [glutamate--ammonia ligase]-adenylyl-L-tyrosine phosphorylase/[glutamate--ammonia-ligase] adenylyltransferase [Planctomycetia bacterium]
MTSAISDTRFALLLARLLPRTADPAMAALHFERLAAQPHFAPHAAALLDPNDGGLESLLQLLATSQLFADTLVQDPDALDQILKPAGRNPSTAELTHQLQSLVDAATDDAGVLRAFRKFRRLQVLRIGLNDVIRDRPLEEISRDLARAADASIQVALATATRTVTRKIGTPTVGDRPARLAALAFGKLGGDELNYSSDLDLMFVYDDDGETAGKRVHPVSNADAFARVITEFLRLLSSHTDSGFAYRVDLRLRPEGRTGPLARSLAATRSYYDVMGRTWERQALIKVRPCGGDIELGREFVQSIEPFVYRKYFSFSEINEVKALKRQMEQRAIRAGDDDRDVKTGRGGIRDIEYTVQFLQLLNGGDLPAVRQRNTLLALESLEIAGCLTGNENYILADAYRFLRKTEHRLQLLFDMQTHRLPDTEAELAKLARRMGYSGVRSAEFGVRSENQEAKGGVVVLDFDSALRTPHSALSAQRRSPLDEATSGPLLQTKTLLVEPLDLFLNDLHDKTGRDRVILEHLLHQTFASESGQAEPESDLILDPDPDEAKQREVLAAYGFRNVPEAYANLLRLAHESVRFLSHRRCRHFLASIAPRLLRAVADTPDPDAALDSLERVTASLGAKAVLYELFSFNPATLKLYVDLCAGSPFLSGLLVNNPGMVDELLDSLVLNQPRQVDELRAELTELLRGATDPEPILHSFQDKELLRIGVADLLGKTPIRETTAALSDLADTVLGAVIDLVEPMLREKFGTPADCPYAIVGLGKLGGREISYHSDLDLMLVYAVDGSTVRSDPGETTSHQHFFTELLQKTIQRLGKSGPMGRLYAVDLRLRPTGKSGSLALPLAEFLRYFDDAGCQLWERQAMMRARVARGDAAFARELEATIRRAALGPTWYPAWANEIRAMRTKLEAKAGRRDIKRGRGGLADVEFLIQWIQLRHGREQPEILHSNVWSALDAIEKAGLILPNHASVLRDGYSFLRTVEARLRIVTDRPLIELPESHEECEKLARRIGFESSPRGSAADRLLAEVDRVMGTLRAEFERLA